MRLGRDPGAAGAGAQPCWGTGPQLGVRARSRPSPARRALGCHWRHGAPPVARHSTARPGCSPRTGSELPASSPPRSAAGSSARGGRAGGRRARRRGGRAGEAGRAAGPINAGRCRASADWRGAVQRRPRRERAGSRRAEVSEGRTVPVPVRRGAGGGGPGAAARRPAEEGGSRRGVWAPCGEIQSFAGDKPEAAGRERPARPRCRGCRRLYGVLCPVPAPTSFLNLAVAGAGGAGVVSFFFSLGFWERGGWFCCSPHTHQKWFVAPRSVGGDRDGAAGSGDRPLPGGWPRHPGDPRLSRGCRGAGAPRASASSAEPQRWKLLTSLVSSARCERGSLLFWYFKNYIHVSV